MLKLLVFDLDGTLVDSRLDLWNSVNFALDSAGLPKLSMEAVMAKVGNGAHTLISYCVAEAFSPLHSNPPAGKVKAVFNAFMEHYPANCLAETRPYPGVIEALNALAGYRKSVLTNKPGLPARRILEALGLSRYFETVLGGDNPFGKKPDPAALKHLMGMHDAEGLSTAMIGDGVQDAQAARAANAWVIAFLGGIGSPKDILRHEPDEAIGSMRDLPEAVYRLDSRASQGPRRQETKHKPSGEKV